MREEARAAVVAALIANDDLGGDDVQVELCWPGDQQADESIWLNPTEGIDVDIPVFHGTPSVSNQITIDDTFTIPIEIMLKATTPTAAEARLSTLRRAVIATFASDPGLSQVSAPTGWRIITAEVMSMDGPGTARGGEWAQSYASVVLKVHARNTS